eukprot:SAG31_NODE_40189_length_282_cov_1.120219_1_plen_27_part_10
MDYRVKYIEFLIPQYLSPYTYWRYRLL